MEGSVYLKARQEWDERYADLVLGKRNWQITAAGIVCSRQAFLAEYVLRYLKMPAGSQMDMPKSGTENFRGFSRSAGAVGILRVHSRA
jgi:hypothetical protein